MPDKKLIHGSALALILLAALLTRVWRCGDGLPYLHKYGEPNIASRSLQILKTGDLNPHWFKYGAPTIYLLAGVDVLHFFQLRSLPPDDPRAVKSLADIETQFDTDWRWSISHPSFYLWNRAALALLGTAVVGLTAWLGYVVAGTRVGILAGALLAGAGAHIELSTTIRSDVLASLFSLASVMCAVLFWKRARPSLLALSFFLAGLAAATKYNAVLTLVAPASALLLTAVRGHPAHRKWLWVAAGILPPIGFLLGNPFALAELPMFLEHAGAEVAHYAVYGQGASDTVEPGLAHALLQFENLRANMTLPGLLLALMGVALLARRPAGWILFAFPAAYGLFMVRTTVAFHHNFVTLYPYLAIGFGAALVLALERLTAWKPAARKIVTAALVVVVTFQLSRSLLEAHAIHAARETRTEAIDLLNRLTAERGWRKIGIAAELRVHPFDLARLTCQHDVLATAELVAAGATYDALLCATDHAARDDRLTELARTARELDALVAPLPIVESIPGGPLYLTIRSIDPGVRVVTAP